MAGETAAPEAAPFRVRMTATVAGFAGLLAIMGFLAWDASWQIRHVKQSSTTLRREYQERDALLDGLRTAVYHASTVVQDNLLLANSPASLSELNDIHQRANRLLDTYEHWLLPEERDSFHALRQRTQTYFESLDQGLRQNTTPWTKPAQRDRFLHDALLPLRSRLIGLVAQVNALDQHDIDSGEERIEALQTKFQARVRLLSLIGLLAAFSLALAVVWRRWRLERETATRYNQVVAARKDLRKLSTRLVQAQEEERRNLSRELHDDIGQSMTAMLMDLGRLESRASAIPGCAPILASIRQTAEHAVVRVRDLSLVLRPSMLDELGLVPALHWQARETERRYGLPVRLTATDLDDDQLPDAVRTCVFRIVQEALHNVVKYAHATEARLTLEHEPAELRVTIADNGRGFHPPRDKGLGLLGMEERATAAGGKVTIESQPGATIIAVRLPLNEEKLS